MVVEYFVFDFLSFVFFLGVFVVFLVLGVIIVVREGVYSFKVCLG